MKDHLFRTFGKRKYGVSCSATSALKLLIYLKQLLFWHCIFPENGTLANAHYFYFTGTCTYIT